VRMTDEMHAMLLLAKLRAVQIIGAAVLQP
jgi:hypothetical protein